MFTRLITFAALLLGASIAQASNQQCKAEDSCPITLTEPFIQSPEECQDEDFTASYEYILQNNTFTDVEIDIYLDPDTPGVDINEDESSCFDFGSSSSPITMSAQESCTIIIDIFIENCETAPPPYTITDQLVVIPHGVNQGPITSDIEVEVIEPSFLTAVPGFQPGTSKTLQSSTQPLLAVFTANHEWENIDTFSDFSSGEFRSATCTGTNDNGICITVGEEDEFGVDDAFMFSSQDGGLNWAPQVTPIAADLEEIILNSVACTNEGNDSAICMTVGLDDVNNFPIALSSTDAGINWDFENLDDLGIDAGLFFDVACTDENNADGFCVAVGSTDIDENNASGIVVTLPFSGTKLQKQIISEAFAFQDGIHEIFIASACTGTGEADVDTVCTVVGGDSILEETSNAVLLISVNGSPFTNWDTEIVGAFLDTACTTAVNGNIVCTAVGATGQGDSMLYVNKNVVADINNWQRVTTADDIILFGTACETNNTKTVCTAVGNNFQTFSPSRAAAFDPEAFLYVNTNVTAFISPWDLVDDLPIAHFNGAACTVTAANNIACTVAGIDENNAPIIFSTPNIDDVDWSIPSVSLPDETCFYGAGASGNSSNLPFCIAFPPAVTLTGPVPETPGFMYCDDEPLSLTYTVENTSDSDVDLLIGFLFNDPYFTFNGGTCFDTDPDSVPANGTCTIEVLITPECDFSQCFIEIEAILEIVPDLDQDPLFDDIFLDLVHPPYCDYYTQE